MELRTARLNAGKSVKAVAEYLGVSRESVYGWESGRYLPKIDKLMKLADFYGCRVDDLLVAYFHANGS